MKEDLEISPRIGHQDGSDNFDGGGAEEMRSRVLAQKLFDLCESPRL